MNSKDVEKFYNDYKSSISTIARIERKLLKESYSYEKWYDTMLLKSKTLRDIYAQNLQEYQNVILYAIENPDELTDDVKSTLLTHIDFFLSEGFKDYGVTVPVLNMLLPYWEEVGNPGKLLDCNYFLGVALGNARFYGEACNAFSRGLACFDDIMDCPEIYWTFRMMCASFYRLMAYVSLDRYNEDVLLEYYTTALTNWTDERLPKWVLSETKKEAIPSVLRNLVCYAISRMLDNDEIPSESLIAVLVDEYYYQSMEVPEEKRNCAADVVYYKYLRATGRCSLKDYEKHLYELVVNLHSYYEVAYTYGNWDFTALFDDETPDDVFDVDKLFFANPSFAYVNYALIELLIINSDKEKTEKICLGIYRYFMELPPSVGDGYIDTLLYPILSTFISHCKDEEMLMDCILNLLVHRQISTAIHVTMVAHISKTIVHYMVKEHPEYFVGNFGLGSKEAVINASDKLEEFVFRAGIIHDVGKLICTDVITLQNRKILNEEFERIKVHPVAGASLLLNSEALFEYSFIALGHHLFDDGSRGYPSGISLPPESARIFIEIVTVCDSIDAMSDTLGRNYANPKDMSTILNELSTEMGTRYSSRVVSLLLETPELIERIRKQLYEERINVHYDIYRKFVMPKVKFRPEDEKFIAPIQEDHLEIISDELNIDPDKLRKLYDKCRNYSYVITDGTGKLFGDIMCEPDGEHLMVRHIYVEPKSRRNGLGSMLVKHVEQEVHVDEISDIYIFEVVEGHYDKFAWHNGYSAPASEIDGWMVKKL